MWSMSMQQILVKINLNEMKLVNMLHLLCHVTVGF